MKLCKTLLIILIVSFSISVSFSQNTGEDAVDNGVVNTGNNEKDNDFILSPVMNDNGDFFDSRDIKDNEKFPQNGDGNGAYNIACKGIIMSEHIKRGLNLFIRSEEWDAWLAGEKIWEKYIAKNLKIRKKVS